MNNLILRWCLGIQDTTRLGDFEQDSKLQDLIWLAKLSIVSFQKWFPEATFLLFYNGDNLGQFIRAFHNIELQLKKDVIFIDQIHAVKSGELQNPYHFAPQGVWWKWVPFRYDINCHEISIDTDIICIGEPLDWYKWLDSKAEIIVAPERFAKIIVNTCGDFHSHPVLNGKKPLNCGIVGHRSGFDFSDRFFNITEEIKYGYTRNSLFITEQGAINVWVYSLAVEGITSYVLDFEKCAWMRDFIYYMKHGVKIETIHATTWHKKIAKQIRPALEQRIYDDSYSDDDFLIDILQCAKSFDYYSKDVLKRQFSETDTPEFFL